MHQHKIGITARRGRERLPSALGDDPNLDPGIFGEQRQNPSEEA
jgi:hypothetical protein